MQIRVLEWNLNVVLLFRRDYLFGISQILHDRDLFQNTRF
jgi:hypothetical protein